MSVPLEAFLLRLQREPAVLVTVEKTRGSVPREAGAWMAVFSATTGGVIGTIGGGNLEWDAMRQASESLAQPGAAGTVWEQSITLGPSLGQCCGGALVLRFERVEASHVMALRQRLTEHHQPLALFGGGHVGRAIVHALAPLPFDVTWIDSRDEVFPADMPAQVVAEHSDPVHAAVHELMAGSAVLIMSFSHAEDLDIVAACLQREREHRDLGFIGLIGSRTKWATFRHRLEQRGFNANELARITCPIGLPGIGGKEPAVIAASVVAQLLLERAGPPGWCLTA
jgi:xanthine dehydrogenase accessory factor